MKPRRPMQPKDVEFGNIKTGKINTFVYNKQRDCFEQIDGKRPPEFYRILNRIKSKAR